MWKCKNKKIGHTEAHITEILQLRHARKTGGMHAVFRAVQRWKPPKQREFKVACETK